MRALGVTTSQRSPVLKQTPTFGEAGINGLELASLWGVVARAGTPKDIVAKWNTAINEALAQPDVREKVLESGAEIVSGPPQQLGDIYADDRERLGAVIRQSNIKLD